MPIPPATVLVGAGAGAFLAGMGVKFAGKGIEAPIRWLVPAIIIVAILMAFLIWKKRL